MGFLIFAMAYYKNSDVQRERRIMKVLTEIGKEAIEPLEEIVKLYENDSGIRKAAEEVLAQVYHQI